MPDGGIPRGVIPRYHGGSRLDQGGRPILEGGEDEPEADLPHQEGESLTKPWRTLGLYIKVRSFE